MKTYNHLSRRERELLSFLVHRGASLRQIARELGRHHTSLSRELARQPGPYQPALAHAGARQRLQTTHTRPLVLAQSKPLRQEVLRLLRLRYSPEIISALLRRRGEASTPCPETLYRYIYTQAPHLIARLPRQHPRRARHLPRFKRVIPALVSVSERPLAAHARKEPGHWESDLLVGSGKSALRVCVERVSRFTLLCKVPNKSAQASLTALKKSLRPLPANLRRSLTYDNGSENFLHAELNAAFPGLRSFFCRPHAPWQKPTVENTNGLIRWFFPKRTNFDNIPEKAIRRLQRWLNARPRKCLHFNSPRQALASLVH